MNGIPGDLYQCLQAALLRCRALDSDGALRAVFVDARLSPWRDALPQADSRERRAQAVLDALWQQTSREGDNALELLLRVLSELTPEGDALHAELAALAAETAQALAEGLRDRIDAIEAQRQTLAANPVLTPELIAQMLELLRAQLAAVEARVAFQQQNQQVGTQTNVARDHITASDHTIVITGDGARIIIGEPEVATPAVAPGSTLAAYLRHIIAQNRYLRLQGIHAGGKLVSIELEQIYITLRATRQRTVQAEEAWLRAEAELAPGEVHLRRHWESEGPRVLTETVTVSVNEALAAQPRLVVLGDPGSGKTTLLRYLALLYARDVAEKTTLVQTRLGLAESARLPVLIPLRRLGAYLKAQHAQEAGIEGHARMLEHLCAMLQGERVPVTPDFFTPYLEAGDAVVLLDGLDEVADPDLRRRVAELITGFTLAYPRCRYVIASRIVGYTGAARLDADYTTTTVRDFDAEDSAQFLCNWHLAVAVGQMGPGETAETWAAEQTRELQTAIRQNERVRELAINPLLLTVIALVHRERVKLPDRRAELYAEAVDVLLGKWDEAKGIQEVAILEGRPFDTGDKRLLLQKIALRLHEARQKEVAVDVLRQWVGIHFLHILGDGGEAARAAERATERFLQVVEERTGLLVGRGEGVYAFSHLTFQEYLAALALAAHTDHITASVAHCGDPWWREVLLLEAGYLSMGSPQRMEQLIEAIAACQGGDAPHANLVLAADALRDVGESRIGRATVQRVQGQLRRALSGRAPLWRRLLGTAGVKDWVAQRSAVTEALVRAGAGYWTPPYGEPEWVEIPAGEFWMGSEKGEGREKPVHKVYLECYWIAKTPITNAQYSLFVEHTGHAAPEDWEDGHPPKGKWSHPVVNVTWYDAMAYCQWLSQAISMAIMLPSEAEWEKAVRGDKDKRDYPWGQRFEVARCNTSELGVGDTTPVGIFLDGASPYGCLEMAGNVWEWTRSLLDFGYPYRVDDGRENLQAGGVRGLRGGAFDYDQHDACCAARHWSYPRVGYGDRGFRVAVSPSRA